MSYRKPAGQNPRSEGDLKTTEHEGKAHPDEYRAGATCKDCQTAYVNNRKRVYMGSPMIGVVPGGSKDTEPYRWHMDFDKGLNAYKKARNEGLQPKSSDLKGVAHAHRQVKSQEKALKKIKNFSDIDGIKTAPGVDRDV
jgi:hypothetical protein